MRSCDAFAVKALLLIRCDMDLTGEGLRKQSAGVNKWIDTVMLDSVSACIEYLEATESAPIRHYGTALHSDKSSELYDYDFCANKDDPQLGNGVALWFGNEVTPHINPLPLRAHNVPPLVISAAIFYRFVIRGHPFSIPPPKKKPCVNVAITRKFSVDFACIRRQTG